MNYREMMDMDTITFIIVTWNNENEIVACLETIQKFSPKDSKVIIVDNQSSDLTATIIRERFPSVQLFVSDKNLGFAGANNLALDLVTTEYICYINPDIILTEDIVTPAINKLKESPTIGLVGSNLRNLDGSHQPSCFKFSSPCAVFNEVLHIGRFIPNQLRKKNFPNYYIPTSDFEPDWLIGAEMVLRTKDAVEIGGFSTEYFMYTEDMDICRKVRQQLGKKIWFMANNSLIHIGGASESQNVNYTKQQKLYENMIYFVTKFDGKKKAVATIKSMIIAYSLRLAILKIGYHKLDRMEQLEKTSKAISMLREIDL